MNYDEISASYKTRVADGAKFLDWHQPDWYEHINLDDLNLGNGDYCILGQLHGGYHQGKQHAVVVVTDRLNKLTSLTREPLPGVCITRNVKIDFFALGFDESGVEDYNTNYSWLTLLWREEIQKRRGRDTRKRKKNG